MVEETEKLREPKDTAIFQQRMNAWYPILDPKWVILGLFGFGCLFVPLGFEFKRLSDGVVEIKHKYDTYLDDSHSCSIRQANANKECTIGLTIDEDMEPPILIYYEIDNFYQSHRKYSKSRDDNQLFGSLTQDKLTADYCQPLNKLGNITLNPCGLIANTFFNDVIQLKSGKDANGNDLLMQEEGIAWESDLQYSFRQPDGFKTEVCDDCSDCSCDAPDWSCTDGQPYVDADGKCHKYYYPKDNTTQYLYETYPMISPLKGVEDEHFVVWMRVAAKPNFRKMYGYVEKPIKAGTELIFQINANWDVSSFKGSKSLIITTTTSFGGKNTAFGMSFLVVGFICIGFGVLFALKHLIKPRKLGDSKYLKYKED